MSVRLSASLRLTELAKLLGRPANRAGVIRLRREIRAREAILGEAILRPGRGPTSPLTTTLVVLREAFPEWFDSRSEMEDLLRTYVSSLENRLDELKGRDSALAREIRILKSRL